MEDLFKKFVNAGVGYLTQGNKKVQSTIEALVKDSKITEQEGKKIVEELMKSGETKRTELEKQFMGLADRMKEAVGRGPKAKKAPAKKASAAKAAGTTKKAAAQGSTAAGAAPKPAAAKAGTAKASAKPKAPKKPAGAPADGPQGA